MAAGLYNFIIEQGATFEREFRFFDVFIDLDDPGNVPRSLTGIGARMQARKKYQSEDVIFSLTLGEGLTITDPDSGVIHMELTSDQTEDFNFSCAVYDLETYVLDSEPEIVDRAFQGEITLSREATR